MITLFKKNIHSFFLALPSNTTTTTTTTTTKTKTSELQYQPISSSSSSSSGLGIMSATRDRDRPPNVVESAMLKPSSSSSPTPPSSPNNMIRNNIGFIDEIGGEVDGLMSCTESLGFESSDERRNDINDNHNNIHHDEKVGNDMDWRSRSRRGGERRKVRSFPPPLRSLNRNGEPSFFLRPVRKDGRLELTEVRIQRPQILHAERHHGRLTLHLIPDHHSIDLLQQQEEDDKEEEDAEVAQEQVDEQVVVEEEAHEEVKEQVRVDVDVDEEEEEEEEEEIGYDENEEEGRFGEWTFENEGLRRCHEMVNQHQHQHHHGVHGSHIHHHHHHLRVCGISIV